MFNVRFTKDYLRHRLKAKTRHGLHSPFVYRLVDKIIYDFNAKTVYNEVESIRRGLLNDNRIITITNLKEEAPANSKTKKTGNVARNMLTSPKLAQLLYRLTKDRQPRTIIELGTCPGITTLYMKKAAPGAKIFILEECPQMANIAKDVCKDVNLGEIECIIGNFDETLPVLIKNLDKLDLVVFHNNDQTDALKYFEWCLTKVHETSLLIFDDIYRSQGMKAAWQQIKEHPKVTVTIDLFWMGLVYFKKGQAKEDFLIRF
jgi:predicted O-methyltransferase YrrM